MDRSSPALPDLGTLVTSASPNEQPAKKTAAKDEPPSKITVFRGKLSVMLLGPDGTIVCEADLVPFKWAIMKVRFWGQPRTKNEEKETPDGGNHQDSSQGG